MTTLVAMFKRPDGGADALAAFERAYAETHLPIVAETPGLRGLRLLRIDEALGATTDLVLICEMDFDDRAALDAGLASEPMRAGGRNLREIAPGLVTLVVAESGEALLPEGWR